MDQLFCDSGEIRRYVIVGISQQRMAAVGKQHAERCAVQTVNFQHPNRVIIIGDFRKISIPGKGMGLPYGAVGSVLKAERAVDAKAVFVPFSIADGYGPHIGGSLRHSCFDPCDQFRFPYRHHPAGGMGVGGAAKHKVHTGFLCGLLDSGKDPIRKTANATAKTNTVQRYPCNAFFPVGQNEHFGIQRILNAFLTVGDFCFCDTGF